MRPSLTVVLLFVALACSGDDVNEKSDAQASPDDPGKVPVAGGSSGSAGVTDGGAGAMAGGAAGIDANAGASGAGAMNAGTGGSGPQSGFENAHCPPVTDAAGEPGSLRFDGFYYDDEVEAKAGWMGPYRDLFRFYEDGVVVQGATSVAPDDTENLDRESGRFNYSGTYVIEGDAIRMTFRSITGDLLPGDVLHEGKVYKDQINLRTYSFKNEHSAERRFLFAARL